MSETRTLDECIGTQTRASGASFVVRTQSLNRPGSFHYIVYLKSASRCGKI